MNRWPVMLVVPTLCQATSGAGAVEVPVSHFPLPSALVEVHRVGAGAADAADLRSHGRGVGAGALGVEGGLAQVDQHGLAGRADQQLAVALVDVEPVDVELALDPGPGGGAGRSVGHDGACARQGCEPGEKTGDEGEGERDRRAVSTWHGDSREEVAVVRRARSWRKTGSPR